MSNQLDTRIRAAVVEIVDAAPTPPRFEDLHVPAMAFELPDSKTVRPRRTRLALAGASLVVIAGVVAIVLVVWASQPLGDGQRVHTSDGPGVPTASSFDRGVTPPNLALPGWPLTYTNFDSVTVQDPESNRLFLIIDDPLEGFGGPRIKVGVTALPGGFTAGPNAQPVDINGTTGYLGTGNGKVYLVWSPGSSSRQIYATGTGASTQQVLTVARGLRIAPDLQSVTATAIPDGLRVTQLPPLSDRPTPNAEYKFQRGDTLLQVNLYPGGRTAFEGRVDEPAHDVDVRGTVGAMNDDTTYGPPGSNPDAHSYRIDILDGRWAVEIAGGPFPDEATFLAAVNATQVSDRG